MNCRSTHFNDWFALDEAVASLCGPDRRFGKDGLLITSHLSPMRKRLVRILRRKRDDLEAQARLEVNA